MYKQTPKVHKPAVLATWVAKFKDHGISSNAEGHFYCTICKAPLMAQKVNAQCFKEHCGLGDINSDGVYPIADLDTEHQQIIMEKEKAKEAARLQQEAALAKKAKAENKKANAAAAAKKKNAAKPPPKKKVDVEVESSSSDDEDFLEALKEAQQQASTSSSKKKKGSDKKAQQKPQQKEGISAADESARINAANNLLALGNEQIELAAELACEQPRPQESFDAHDKGRAFFLQGLHAIATKAEPAPSAAPSKKGKGAKTAPPASKQSSAVPPSADAGGSVPLVFLSGDAAILTEKLRAVAQELVLAVMGARQLCAKEETQLIFDVARSLTLFAPTCEEGWEALSTLCHESGRYADAIDALTKIKNGDNASRTTARIEAIWSEMKHTKGQMGCATEVRCPICLSDAIEPVRMSTQCPHLCCKACFPVLFDDRASNQPSGCPMCRGKLLSHKSLLVVNPVEQRNYYLRRVNDDGHDVVGWYNLSRVIDDTPDDDDDGEAGAVIYKRLSSGATADEDDLTLSTTRRSLLCLREVFLNSTDGSLPCAETWVHFAAALLELTQDLPLERRRSCYFDLGELFGQVNAFDAVMMAINLPGPEEKAEVGWSSILAWRSVVELMCRDFAAEVRDGSFKVNIHGKMWKPLDLALEMHNISGYCLTAKKGPETSCYALIRIIFVLFLQDGISSHKKLRLMSKGEEWQKRDCEDVFSVPFESYSRDMLRPNDFACLAQAWRSLSSTWQMQLKSQHQLSTEHLWGQAIGGATYTQQIHNAADCMLEGECAVVKGSLMSRSKVYQMAAERH